MTEKRNIVTVAIDGPDGVGKETQVGMLAKYLRGRSTGDLGGTGGRLTVETVAFPNVDAPFHDEIYRALADGSAFNVVSFTALQFCNRYCWQRYSMRRVVRSADVVVFDRWSPSLYAYTRALGVPREDVTQLIRPLFVPDVNIILVGTRHGGYEQGDTYERDSEFQRVVCSMFEEWASTGLAGNVHIVNIDGMSRNDVHAEVVKIVEAYMHMHTRDDVADVGDIVVH